MTIQTSTMTCEQVINAIIDLATHLPIDQLASWYQYGLFIQSKPVWTPTTETSRSQNELDLAEEFAMWEEASNEDWLKLEMMLKESA